MTIGDGSARAAGGGPRSGRIVAMWSGPRNISTAMMRAWENRADTSVVDEPFYAHFLASTGLDHPMREDVIAAGETDWRDVVERIVAPPAPGRIHYQKHIATHWLEHFTTDWLGALDHAFLIREPEPVVASYAAKRGAPTPADLGYVQQAALFDHLAARSSGGPPPVVDSARFLADPEGQLRTLCERLGIAFDPAMLAWPPGARDSDGVWGAHWYDAVVRSTGFAAPRAPERVELDAAGRRVAQVCRPYYEALARHAI